jgi:hypothetical protein
MWTSFEHYSVHLKDMTTDTADQTIEFDDAASIYTLRHPPTFVKMHGPADGLPLPKKCTWVGFWV